MTTPQNINLLLERLKVEETLYYPSSEEGVDGTYVKESQPILIGDVLKRVRDNHSFESNPDPQNNEIVRIAWLWHLAGGEDLSLQSIIEKSQYVHTIDPCCGDNEGSGHTHLKDPSARNLCELLITLFTGK